MLLAFATDSELVARVAVELQKIDSEVRSLVQWDKLAVRWDAADAVVVAFRDMEEDVGRRLEALRLGRPFMPLVVVAPGTLEVLRCLMPVRVDAFVPAEAMDTLGERVREMIGTTFFQRAADLVRFTPGVPDDLRYAVAIACAAADEPYGSVKRFSRETGLDRRRIARAVGRTTGGAEGVRFEDVLDAIFLVYVTRVRESTGSWDAVAQSVGRKRTTLREMAARLLGWELRTLSRVGSHEVALQVMHRVILPVLRCQEGSFRANHWTKTGRCPRPGYPP